MVVAHVDQELAKLAMERHRIIFRGAARKMARAVAQSSNETLMRHAAFTEGLKEAGIQSLDLDEVRQIAGNMAKKTNDQLDRILPDFFAIMQAAGFGEMDIVEGAQLFCERLKE